MQTFEFCFKGDSGPIGVIFCRDDTWCIFVILPGWTVEWVWFDATIVGSFRVSDFDVGVPFSWNESDFDKGLRVVGGCFGGGGVGGGVGLLVGVDVDFGVCRSMTNGCLSCGRRN